MLQSWGAGRVLYHGRGKKVAPNSHPPSYSPISVPKLVMLWFDYAVPEKGEGCSHVKNDPWALVQFNGHKHYCFRNDWRNSVAGPGVSPDREKCKINKNSPVCDYNLILLYCSHQGG